VCRSGSCRLGSIGRDELVVGEDDRAGGQLGLVDIFKSLDCGGTSIGFAGGFVFKNEQVDELRWVLGFLSGGVEPAPRLVLGDVPNELLDRGLHAIDGVQADLVVGGLIDRQLSSSVCAWSTMRGRGRRPSRVR
jgi:hypothetical protein